MEIRPITKEDAIEICNWQYDGIYSVYNFASYEKCKERGWNIADDEKRGQAYVAVYDEGKLFGFFNIMDREDRVELGVGMRPDQCGKHFGKDFVSLAVETVNQRYPQKKIVLKVRSFNKRAVKCYESCGFKVTGRYEEKTFYVPGEMLIMER